MTRNNMKGRRKMKLWEKLEKLEKLLNEWLGIEWIEDQSGRDDDDILDELEDMYPDDKLREMLSAEGINASWNDILWVINMGEDY